MMPQIRLPGLSLLFLVVVATAAPVAAQEQPEEGEQREPVVAARVDDVPIHVHDVERIVDKVTGKRPLQGRALDVLRAKTLARLVNRQLIVKFLRQTEVGATDQDIDLAVGRIKQQLERQDATLDDYLKQARMTPDELRRSLAWQLGWQKYLDRFLTDENLSKYFGENRAEFDGTQLQVAHILFKVEKPEADESWDEVVEQARAVRQRIVDGELGFAAAAAQYSAGATADKGGALGWIQRHEPMPEAFSRMAFRLQPSAVSEPVETPFGVHLIRCLEIKPGTRQWQQVRRELTVAVTEYLFEWAADQARPGAEIRFTGKAPYFDPQTGKLVR